MPCKAPACLGWAGLGVTCMQKGKSWIRQVPGCGQRSPPFSFLWLLLPGLPGLLLVRLLETRHFSLPWHCMGLSARTSEPFGTVSS